MAENKIEVRKGALKDSGHKSNVSKAPALHVSASSVHVDPLGGSPVTENSSKVARVGSSPSVSLSAVPPLPGLAAPIGFDGLSARNDAARQEAMANNPEAPAAAPEVPAAAMDLDEVLDGDHPKSNEEEE